MNERMPQNSICMHIHIYASAIKKKVFEIFAEKVDNSYTYPCVVRYISWFHSITCILPQVPHEKGISFADEQKFY